MNTANYRESSHQQSSRRIYPSKGGSQFKAPLSTQTGTLQAQQSSDTPERTFPSRGSQFKTPLTTKTEVLRKPNQQYVAMEASFFDSASLYRVTSASRPAVHQAEKRKEQSGYYSPSEVYRSNIELQDTRPIRPLPSSQAIPSVSTGETYATGNPITQKRSIFTMPSHTISTDSYIGVSAPLSSRTAQAQSRSQFLREPDQSWQRTLPRTEPLASAEAPRKTKTHVMMKIIIMVGTGVLVGGLASFWLLRFPTYLVVTWAILIIVLSNLLSREVRAYYHQLKSKIQPLEVELHSTVSPLNDEDTGGHPVLKDISDTTGYLKALCFVFKPGSPTQNLLQEEEYRVW